MVYYNNKIDMGKFKGWISVIVSLVILIGCGGEKIRFIQSGDMFNCMVREDFSKVIIQNSNGTQMGVIDLTEIQEKEGKFKSFIWKWYNGVYFLTGENFKNIYIITPKKDNTASYKAVKLPKKVSGRPVFIPVEDGRLKVIYGVKDEIMVVVDKKGKIYQNGKR